MTYLGYFIPEFEQNGQENCSLFSKYSINFHAVKCRYLVFIRRNRLVEGLMLRAVFSHATVSKVPFFARGCVEKYSVYENALYIMARI